jgi:exopolysaccharide production protein ExoZ
MEGRMAAISTGAVAGRLDTLQSLRFVAALMVVLYHANMTAAAQFPREGFDVLSRLVETGRAGVHVFFVISGFIMWHLSQNTFGRPGEARAFLLRRLTRIFPTYWLVFLLTLLLDPEVRAGLEPTLRSLVGAALLWPGEAERVVAVAWTLSYELWFYAIMAVALVLPRQWGLAFIVMAILASVATGKLLGLGADTQSGEAMYGSELLLFLGGIGIGILASHRKLYAVARRGSVVAALALAGVACLLISPLMRLGGFAPMVSYGPGALLAVAAAVALDTTSQTPRPARWLAALGDSSYSLYLTHELAIALAAPPILAVLYTTGGGNITFILVATVASVAVGHAFHLAVERPLLLTVRRGFTRRGTGQLAGRRP